MTNLNRVFKEAVELINGIAGDEKGSRIIIARQKKLAIIKDGEQKSLDVEIGEFSSFERSAGLTARGWEKVRGNIRGLIVRGILE